MGVEQQLPPGGEAYYQCRDDPRMVLHVRVCREGHLHVHCHGPFEHYDDQGWCDHLLDFAALQQRMGGEDVRPSPWCGYESAEEYLEANQEG